MFSQPTMIRILCVACVITSYFLCKHVGETLTGRIGRRRFIIRQFIILGFSTLFGVIGMMYRKSLLSHMAIDLVDYFILYGMICTLIFGWWFVITTDVKRLHDMNIHGAWYVAFYATLVACAMLLPEQPLLTGIIYLVPRLLLCVVPGSKEVNKYGHNHDKHYIL